MTDPITTPAEALEAAARIFEALAKLWETMPPDDAAMGVRAHVAVVRALASRIPELGKDDVERVALAIQGAHRLHGRCWREMAKASLLAMRPAKGWRLVPVEPTQAMLEAADVDSMTERGVWSAMLAAAPAQGREG